MNVTELIRELKTTREEFFPVVKELGFDIGERAIKVDDRVANQVMEAFRAYRKEKSKKSVFDTAKIEGQEEKKEVVVEEDKRAVALPSEISVKAFGERLGKSVTEIIPILMRNGIMATMNERIDYETAAIVAEDLGFTVEQEEDSGEDESAESVRKLEGILATQEKTSLKDRPPVVVVMGHVDHGKTRLLDAIRKTSVIDTEAGGITQSIGAYQAKAKGKALTFIDTPGHEAFTAMRSRGANVADIAILVIAADDSIKPQTIEAIDIIGKANLPFVVALNKIDKPEADVERVKKDLSELNLIPEDWGGKTIVVPISAKEGTGIDTLLENLELVAEVHAETITADPSREAVGTIIESHVDKNIGAVATVLVQTGTLNIGDLVTVGSVPGKVKAMTDWNGKRVKKAVPSTPVQILGLKGVPQVGEVLEVVSDRKSFKKTSKQYSSFAVHQVAKEHKGEKEAVLNILIKADTLGSLEAILESLEKIEVSSVGHAVIHKGLGNVTESDLAQAEASNAHVIAFNVKFTPGASDYAATRDIPFQTYDVIYHFLDYVTTEMEKIRPSETILIRTGELKVLAIFKVTEKTRILGGKVTDGSLLMDAPVKIKRNGKEIGEGTITQLQMEKKNVPEIPSGTEGGLKIETTADLEEGDIVEAYKTEQRQID